jgi:hypothetical protein
MQLPENVGLKSAIVFPSAADETSDAFADREEFVQWLLRHRSY